ncbi:MAG: hypothetical protein PHX70_03020 [Clostridium sp.]|nr:hypothetical protein [Clostridium sp.]
MDLMSGGSSKGSKLLVWGLIIFVIFGFGKGKKLYNNFNFDVGEKKEDTGNSDDFSFKHVHRHEHQEERKHRTTTSENKNFMNFKGMGGNKGFGKILGGNGIFILVIVAILFLCKDKKRRHHLRNVNNNFLFIN